MRFLSLLSMKKRYFCGEMFYKCFSANGNIQGSGSSSSEKEDGTYNVKIRVTQARKSKYIKTSQFVSAQDISRKKEKGVEKIKSRIRP